MALIELEKISKKYGKDEYTTVALKGIDLTVHNGEFVSIMGPSGSGKSTLLNIIGCVDVPTEGIYRLDGINVTTLRDKELSQIRNRTISFVFQHFALMHNFTVFENVALPLFKRDISKKEIKEKVDYYLEKLGIADLRKRMSRSCQEGKSSEWPLHAQWRQKPISCSQMNQQVHWIKKTERG